MSNVPVSVPQNIRNKSVKQQRAARTAVYSVDLSKHVVPLKYSLGSYQYVQGTDGEGNK